MQTIEINSFLAKTVLPGLQPRVEVKVRRGVGSDTVGTKPHLQRAMALMAGGSHVVTSFDGAEVLRQLEDHCSRVDCGFIHKSILARDFTSPIFSSKSWSRLKLHM